MSCLSLDEHSYDNFIVYLNTDLVIFCFIQNVCLISPHFKWDLSWCRYFAVWRTTRCVQKASMFILKIKASHKACHVAFGLVLPVLFSMSLIGLREMFLYVWECKYIQGDKLVLELCLRNRKISYSDDWSKCLQFRWDDDFSHGSLFA